MDWIHEKYRDKEDIIPLPGLLLTHVHHYTTRNKTILYKMMMVGEYLMSRYSYT